MPKINREEYEVLKGLDDKWKWIARDEHLKVLKEKPHKMKVASFRWELDWCWGNYPRFTDSEILFNNNLFKLDESSFVFINKEDEEPHNIAELIEEYEYKTGTFDWAAALRRALHGESEETEVKKNIEWAKEETHKELDSWRNVEGGIDDDGINEVLNIIDQLDEPEVLSSDWIEENKFKVDNWNEAVHVDDLQNLLVPKQDEITESFKETVRELTETSELAMDVRKLTGMTLEEIKEEARNGGIVPKQELPVIPKFVANYIQSSKDIDRTLFSAMQNVFEDDENKVNDWLWDGSGDDSFQVFAKAWLAYPNIEVEKEQKYRVIFPSVDESGKGFNYLAKDTYHNELWVEDSRTDGLAWEERSSFTEDEIRDLDKGDILFEHFAVKAEEVEE